MIHKKILLFIFISVFSFAQAELINAIAITVNDKVISLYDIDKKMLSLKISKQKAVGDLIDEKLYESIIEKSNISVDSFDVDKAIEQLAKNNKMSSYQFKSAIKQQENYNVFKEKIKKQLKHQKLIAKISSNKLIRATDEDIKIYYENHKEEYQISNNITAIEYSSRNKKALFSIKKNPMMNHADVRVRNINLEQNSMPPQIKFIVNKTKAGTYTSIFAANKTYNLLYISKKENVQNMTLEDTQDTIFGIIMKERERDYLKNYFETLKLTADIKVLR